MTRKLTFKLRRDREAEGQEPLFEFTALSDFADRWYPARSEPWYDILTASPPGALFLWDARYGPSPDFGISLELLRAYPLWAEIGQTTVDGENGPFVCIFERQP